MDWQVIANLISSVGFPIGCSVALFWLLNRANENHNEEMRKMVDALNNNTKVLEMLKEKIENGKN